MMLQCTIYYQQLTNTYSQIVVFAVIVCVCVCICGCDLLSGVH